MAKKTQQKTEPKKAIKKDVVKKEVIEVKKKTIDKLSEIAESKLNEDSQISTEWSKTSIEEAVEDLENTLPISPEGFNVIKSPFLIQKEKDDEIAKLKEEVRAEMQAELEEKQRQEYEWKMNETRGFMKIDQNKPIDNAGHKV